MIDVREPFEYEIARIPGTKLIPLSQVVARMNEIDPSRETVMHCKAGVRSAKAIASLKAGRLSRAAYQSEGRDHCLVG